jgi:hypothetical protein
MFKALIGLLTGDPASPILWNLFLADLSMLPDFEDSFLAGVRISLLAQADDLLIVSLSVRGLQVKLGSLEQWCAKNFILVNLIKTIVLIFGAVPIPLPRFFLGSKQLEVKADEKYVGVNWSTDTRNPLSKHYTAKAKKDQSREKGRRDDGNEEIEGKERLVQR